MQRWEYAMLSDPDTGDDGVLFSHDQGPQFVPHVSKLLGRGLKAERSNGRWLHVNMSHTNPVVILGLLGEMGWELCGFATLPGGHAYWTLKRPLS